MAKVTKVKPKEGRPTDYNPEIANRICELISMSEKGIHKLYAENQDWMPVPSTIMLWLTKHPAFSEQYTLAKRLQMDLMGEKIIDIVDDSSGDVLITERGNIAENREFTSRSKLRAETRMWLMERLSPKVYGKQIEKESDKQIETYQPPNITVNISQEAIDKLKK